MDETRRPFRAISKWVTLLLVRVGRLPRRIARSMVSFMDLGASMGEKSSPCGVGGGCRKDWRECMECGFSSSPIYDWNSCSEPLTAFELDPRSKRFSTDFDARLSRLAVLAWSVKTTWGANKSCPSSSPCSTHKSVVS